MKRILLTIDDPAWGDKDYIICDTRLSKTKLQARIKEVGDDSNLTVNDIMDILRKEKSIIPVSTKEIGSDWVVL